MAMGTWDSGLEGKGDSTKGRYGTNSAYSIVLLKPALIPGVALPHNEQKSYQK